VATSELPGIGDEGSGKRLRLVDAERPWGDDDGPPPEQDKLPEIRLGPDVHRVCDELDAILGPVDPLLYQRAHELVTVAGSGRSRMLATGTPIVRTLTANALLTRVTRHVQMMGVKPPSKRAIEQAEATGRAAPPESRKVQPPPNVLGAFLALPDWHHVRELCGVTESPLFRPDGTVRQEPGYDEATGYLYRPSCEYPAVPEHPTKGDAEAALAELVDVFCDFPYADEPSRYVPIAAILAVLARAAIDGPVPAFLFDASVMGSGKTLQCDVAHVIAVGRIPSHADWPSKPEEQEKLLSTYAISSPQALVIDNIKGTLGGGKLEATLTSISVEFRMLGVLELRSLPWRSVILLSGNNIQLTEDMIRRTLMSRLESPLERPTDRVDFKRTELLSWVISGRPRLVVLALTILRAYACHGWPDTGVRIATYQSFARVVGGAIRFAGGEDISKARPPEERAGFDDAGAVRAIVDRWHTVAPEAAGPVSLKHFLECIYPAPARDEPPDGHDELREAFEQLTPSRGSIAPSAVNVGKRLKGQADRWFGNRRLRIAIDKHRNIALWRVETRQGNK
jgi:hypothetical protein